MGDLTAERLTGIGGSDAHHVWSLPPYGCARKLWYEKRQTPPDYPPRQTRAMARGLGLEDIAAKLVAAETGLKLRRAPMFRHPDFPWLIAHVDREIVSRTTPLTGQKMSGPGNLEIKTCNQWAWRKLQSEGPLPGTILQVQHGLYVTRREWAVLAHFWPDGWQLSITEFFQNDGEFFAERGFESGTSKFWRQVENGPAPDRLDPSDRRCQSCPWRHTCQGERLIELARDEDPSAVEVDPGLADLAARCLEYGELSREAAALYEGAKAELRKAMGDRTRVETAGARVYYRPHERTSIDPARLRKEKPEIAAEYSKTSVVRPLKVYPI